MDFDMKWMWVCLMVGIVMAGLSKIYGPQEQTFETEQKLQKREVHRIKIDDGDTTYIYKTKNQ